MKLINLIIIVCSLVSVTRAQKLPVNDTTYKKWQDVRSPAISNNGGFAHYTIINGTAGNNTLVVLATDKSWERRFIGLANAQFSPNNKYLFASKGADTLVKLVLGTDQQSTFPSKGYSILDIDKPGWIVYRSIEPGNALIVENLSNGKKQRIQDVQSYTASKDWNSILLNRKTNLDSVGRLELLSLSSGRVKNVYRGYETSDYVFDKCGNYLAFTLAENGVKRIAIYNNIGSALHIVKNTNFSGEREWSPEFWQFTSDCTGLLLTSKIGLKGSDESKDVSIWNYNDSYLLSEYKTRELGFREEPQLHIIDLPSLTIRKLVSSDLRIFIMP